MATLLGGYETARYGTGLWPERIPALSRGSEGWASVSFEGNVSKGTG